MYVGDERTIKQVQHNITTEPKATWSVCFIIIIKEACKTVSGTNLDTGGGGDGQEQGFKH